MGTRTECSERLKYYGQKASQHLSRVRLSHVLGLEALSAHQHPDEQTRPLVQQSFESHSPTLVQPRLASVLHEVHLVALKANFELYLNRALVTVWTYHFDHLVEALPRGKRIKRVNKITLKELAAGLLPNSEFNGSAREFVIGKVVPSQALEELTDGIADATGVQLPKVARRADAGHWPQIVTAFAVRHLVEHRDGKVDTRFRLNVADAWRASSWGRRGDVSTMHKVNVNAEDVECTYRAMLETAVVVTDELRRWSAAQKAR